jgi:hypothetical protein
MMTSTYLNRANDGAVKAGQGILTSVVLAAGSDTATVTIYDEASASGNVMCKLVAAQNTSAVATQLNIAFGVGCYVDIEGTAAAVTVGYI